MKNLQYVQRGPRRINEATSKEVERDMMEEFTDEQKMLRATMQNFVEKEVSPLAYEIDRDERLSG
jgi:hypothetical protein